MPLDDRSLLLLMLLLLLLLPMVSPAVASLRDGVLPLRVLGVAFVLEVRMSRKEESMDTLRLHLSDVP